MIEIEQVVNRLLEKVSADSDVAPRRQEAAPRVASILRDRGYPERHIQALRAMHGPGLEKARALMPVLLRGDCLLLLVGDRGPGKTQIATWWGAQLLREGKSAGHYRKTLDVLGEIRETWGKQGKSEESVLQRYRKTPYLVLDEFDVRAGADWDTRVLVNIVDHRYDAQLRTVIISNVAEGKIADAVNPSIMSRAEECGGLVVCDWGSYRTNQ